MKSEKQELTVIQPGFETVLSTNKEIELTKAQAHASAFAPSMVKYHEIAAKLSELDKENPTPEMAKIARRCRLDLVPIRTEAGTIKDERKAILLTESNLIQSLYNVVKQTCELTESEFLEIEKHQERLEAIRLTELEASRKLLLEPYGEINQFVDLKKMDDETFAKYLSTEKLAFETRLEQEKQAELARIEAELKLEKERVEAERLEKERLEAQRIENEKLKAEAEKREKELAIEREKLAKENAEKERLAKIEADKQAKILSDEKAKSDLLAKQLRDKEEAEKLAQEQEKARIEAEESEKLAKEKLTADLI